MQELPEGGGRCVKGRWGGPSCTESEERRGRVKLVWRLGQGAWRVVVRTDILSQAASALLVQGLENREEFGVCYPGLEQATRLPSLLEIRILWLSFAPRESSVCRARPFPSLMWSYGPCLGANGKSPGMLVSPCFP